MLEDVLHSINSLINCLPLVKVVSKSSHEECTFIKVLSFVSDFKPFASFPSLNHENAENNGADFNEIILELIFTFDKKVTPDNLNEDDRCIIFQLNTSALDELDPSNDSHNHLYH